MIVINEAMARRFFGTANPIGRRMLWGEGKGAKALEVVGVVSDVKQHGPRDRMCRASTSRIFKTDSPSWIARGSS